MSEWKEYKLGDVIKSNATSITNTYSHKVIQYLDTGSITCGKLDSYQEIELQQAPSRAKRLVKDSDIIYSTVRPIQRHYGFIKNPPNNLVVSTGFAVIETNKELADPLFIYNLLSSKESVEFLDTIAEASTSTYPSLKPSDIEDLDIILPPLPEQKAIAAVLSSLDDKIDLLQRQNKTLEAMAETLFRQWFVEESEIPSEKQILLGDLIESISNTYKFQTSQIIFLNTSDIYLGNVLNNIYENVKKLPGQAKKCIAKGDILFSEIRPANGRYAYIDFDAKDYVVSTKLMVLRSKNKNNISQAFIYFYLTNKKTVDWLQMLAEARSGTFPQITFEQLKDLQINIPSDEIANNTSQLCDKWLKKIKFNHAKISTLEKLRDNLLPKLMSGEVRVEI